MHKLEHIGIAVRNMVEGNALFARLLGSECYKIETVEEEGVKTSFFRVGEVKIELLEATRPDSPISKFLEKRGEGIHHLAFEVDNIYTAIEYYRRLGFEPLTSLPKKGADNKLICFLHPKTTQGVLIELCQSVTGS